MAFARLILQSRNINKLVTILKEEKQKSIEANRGDVSHFTVRQKWRYFWLNQRICMKKCCKKALGFRKGSYMYRLSYKLKYNGTCENFTFKSIVGFIGGFLLTYIFFMFFVLQLNFKLSTATIMCAIFGSILTIGLAFSYKVRCVVLLLLPQFFSKRGRQALMAYAFILAITGPAKNTLHNMGILSESLACGQKQLKMAVRQIVEAVKKPFIAIRDAIKTVVKTVKVIVKKIKEIMLTIKRIILGLVRVIKAAFQFLGKILNVCNKELGTPFQRCMNAFDDAITDCNAKLGPFFSWLCSITYIVQSVCYVVKIFDYICIIIDFISDSIVGVVFKKIKLFIRHVKTIFYVKIRFSHSFHFETNQSKSANEVTEGIVTEVRQRTEKLMAVFDFMSCATSMFFLVIILRVLHYRYKFLTSDRFDNRFITRNFRNIDMRRAQLEKETVLPLNHRERAMYINVNSIRLVKIERLKLTKAAVALGVITLKLSTHMMADYSLYWVLMTIRYHARFQSKIQAPNVVGLHIEGHGFIANLLRSIVTAFQPLGLQLEIDTIPCLPDPIPPDYDRYIQIATLLLLCWVLTILEPYGLRLRHSVMCYYNPIRARQRAIWLYNHVIRSRSSFLKYARRQLRRKVTGAKNITKITFKEYLRANINSRFLLLCLGADEQEACLLCADVFRESDLTKPIRCSKPGCPGIYCERCFADLQNLCTVCLEPIQYGDLSDISEEKDSSENEEKEKRRKKRKCRISKCLKKKRDEDSDDSDYRDKDRDYLLPRKSKHEPPYSDYETEFETDNSYTYQKTKSLTDYQDNVADNKFRDVEKQEIPDYASWDESKEFVKYQGAIVNRQNVSYVSLSTSSDDFEIILPTIRKQLKETVETLFSKQNTEAPTSTIESQLDNYVTGKDKESSHSLFDNRVKHDIVNESEKSLTASSETSKSTSNTKTTRSSRRSSSMDNNVSKSDTVVCETSPSKLSSSSSETKNVVQEQVQKLKSLERKKRLEEVMYNNRYKYESNSNQSSFESSEITLPSNKSGNSPSSTSSYFNDKPYQLKIKNYYKQINKSINDKPVAQLQPNTNKIVKFFKNIFKKKKIKDDSCQLEELKSSGEALVVLSPKPLSKTSTNRENKLQLSTASSDKYLFDSSVPSSTKSTELSLMGSVESFAQKRANKNNLQLADKSSVLQKHEDFSSSDSEITDLDVYFRTSHFSNSTPVVTPEKKLPPRSLPNLEKNTRFETVASSTLIEQTARFSREPPERDENSSSLCIMTENCVNNESMPRYVDNTPFFDADNQAVINKNRCCSCPVKIDKFYNPDVLNKAYSDPRSCDRNHEHNKNCRCFKKNKTGNNIIIKCSRNSSSGMDRKRSPEHIKYSKAEEDYRCSYRPSPPPLPTAYKSHEDDKMCMESDKCKRYYCEECSCICQKTNCAELCLPQSKPLNSGDDDGSGSDVSGCSECPNLVYQHTEEYLDLVNELGETLSLRNKNRVETTIREFEVLSRQNKCLKKPIFDDDQDEEGNVETKRHCCCCACCCRRPRTCELTSNSKTESERDAIRLSYRQHKIIKHPQPNVAYSTYQPPRWQKDYRTGRWYKICDDFDDEAYRHCARPRYNSVSPPTSPNQRMCNCDQCARCNSKCNSGTHDDCCRNSSAVCRCNCEYSCDMWY